jgi:hypothetical protein
MDWAGCGEYGGNPTSCLLCQTLHPARRIEPGGFWESEWTPWLAIETTLPSSCSDDGTPSDCQAPILVPPGTYEITAIGATPDGCEIDACACDPDVSGSCDVDFETAPADYPLEATARWTAGCDPLVVVFQ